MNSRNEAQLWTPPGHPGFRLFKARFTSFVFDRHAHEEFALGVIEEGGQRFVHKGARHEAPPLSIISVNPDEVHDGQSATCDGYAYRMLYVGIPTLEALFDGAFRGRDLHAFKSPVTVDAPLARSLDQALRVVELQPERLDELLLPMLHTLFSRHAFPRLAVPCARHDAAVRQAREYLRAHALENPTLDALAREVGLSKFHLLRVFKEATGLAPHAWLLRHRVQLGRKALEQGRTPAEAAALAGFADQSHFTRRFKAVHGLTPGAFAAMR
ncbi:AraC family transcriptional regulator [Megalodesulfovibrio gigas]|uniref:Putative AraC family transcriptional regulator n=1 Tax=Megalodesulfovibrio gigas (strain ATCC 19364 / DSM 1382 / NCIMB 9332 / VKM B-1759) TaxID=1121448 RepID=T2GAN4_MEGG1|nr:AraC family transcriptional regulator [Megalodesulfovibrio gigas]AGW13635.1 putative AraC family transcriptional regulator [Megalodesulfovibrio gigas DSM 1382 = ATCC 19364]